MLDNSSSNDNIPKPSQPPIWPRWTKEEMDKVLSEKPVPDGPFWIWDYGIEFQDKLNTARLYPLKLLQHLLTREVLSQEVRAIEGVNDPDKVVEQVLGSEALAGDTYIKIFAILKMIHKLSKLQCFIEAGVSDQKLVLSCDESQNYALSYGGSKTPVPSDLLEPFERKSFSMEQFNMHLPFFSNQTAVQDLSWTKVPSEDRFFALKQLNTDDPASFKREVEMLRRFNSTKHRHLVSLLAAFTHNENNYLIFPWATHDLKMYWEEIQPTPNSEDIDLIRWVCDQALMLVQAISAIHVPDEDENVPENERLYGRHGDMKPENILWYKSRGFGKLVIADMGLSKTHRHQSRTYNPHNRGTAAPKYRPPELDYEEGLMGRTFDIWTLGCVFFELLHWLHGGHKKLEEVEEAMLVPSIRGSDSIDYYEWVYVQDVNYYTVRVKKAVTQCISNLRRECSQFVCDFLDIIENRMLVVERSARISAKELVKEMEILNKKCNDEDTGSVYCVEKERRQMRNPPKPGLQRREFRRHLLTAGRNIIPRVLSSDFR
ncbi:kinase-like domain-containing protein [Nemania serpens]|nr:kinase-like domain-containing protein [Nemania serpens]